MKKKKSVKMNIQLSLFSKEVNSIDKVLYQNIIQYKDKVINHFKNQSFNTRIAPEYILIFKAEYQPFIISNKEFEEPEDIRLFSRRIKCWGILYDDKRNQVNEITFKEKEYICEPWESILLTENNTLPIEYFVDIAHRIYSLKYALEQIEQNKENLKNKIKSGGFIILFEHKLFNTNLNTLGDSLPIGDEINGFERNLESLLQIIKEFNGTILGIYSNFTNDDDLIRNLDEKFYTEFSLDKGKYIPIEFSFKSYFFSDFLFLNNAEFPFQKIYTLKWGNIVKPFIKEDSLDFYFYIKNEGNSPFQRFEVFNRNNSLNTNDIISFSHEVLRFVTEKNLYKK